MILGVVAFVPQELLLLRQITLLYAANSSFNASSLSLGPGSGANVITAACVLSSNVVLD